MPQTHARHARSAHAHTRVCVSVIPVPTELQLPLRHPLCRPRGPGDELRAQGLAVSAAGQRVWLCTPSTEEQGPREAVSWESTLTLCDG